GLREPLEELYPFLFGPGALGHVTGNSHRTNDAAGVVAVRSLDRGKDTRGARDSQLLIEATGESCLHDVSIRFQDPLCVDGIKKFRMVLAEDILDAFAQDLRAGSVEREVSPLPILGVDGIMGSLDDGTKERLALTDRRLRTGTVRHDRTEDE